MKFELKANNRGAADEDMVEDLKRCADELGQDTVTPKQYREIGRFGERTFARRFGSWSRALQLAQLEPSRTAEYSEIELFKNIRDLWIYFGRQPHYHYKEVRRPASRFSVKVYKTTFGSWSEALRQFVCWANNDANEEVGTSTSTAVSNLGKKTTPKRKRTSRNISDR